MCWTRKKRSSEGNAPTAMDTDCPGCGKHLKDIQAWEKHAKQCKKLAEALQSYKQGYNIPSVSVQELPYLQVKLLSPNGKEWGIWNSKHNDWIKDKSGQIDSRLFQRNIKTLLNSLTAKSILYGGELKHLNDKENR